MNRPMPIAAVLDGVFSLFFFFEDPMCGFDEENWIQWLGNYIHYGFETYFKVLTLHMPESIVEALRN